MVDAYLPDLIDDLAICQGGTYLALSKIGIEFEGDLTSATWEGDIRDNYRENGGVLLGELDFLTPTYNAETNTTTVYPILSFATTEALPGTAWKTGRNPSLSNCYVWDVEGIEDGIIYKKFPAFCAVKSEVTGAGTPPPPLEQYLLANNNLSEITDAATARQNLGVIGSVKPDWDAEEGANEEILNKPDLTVYAEIDAVSLALSGKQDADPSILKSANIGNTVQAYDANTVVDSEYPAIKDKANSAVQPEALTPLAPLNNPVFTGTQLILPNNTRINGVEHFYQTTKPTVRGDGSALVVGDRWWKVDDGTEWFWNGSYWLSPLHEKFIGIGPPSSAAITTLTRVSGFPLPLQQTFLLIDILWSFGSRTGNHDNTTNYWYLLLRSIQGLGTAENKLAYSYNSNAYSSNPLIVGVHDVYVNLSEVITPNTSTTTWDIAIVPNGSPFPISGVGVRVRYHLIAP